MYTFLRFVCVVMVAGSLLEGAQTIYRYRAFEGTEALTSVSDYVVAETQLPEIATIPRGGSEDPFDPFVYAKFSGEENYVSEPFPGEGSLDGDFTISAHVKLDSSGVEDEMEQTIVSTMESGGDSGISLKVESGELKGAIWLKTDSGNLNKLTLTSEEALEAGKWHRITYRYHRNGDGSAHFHDLWIDQEKTASQELHSLLSRSVNELPPVFGAERSPSGGYIDYLHADVFAVQLDDYPLDDFFLRQPLIRDGSDYFGMVSFHDYLGLEDWGDKIGGEPLESRIISTYFDLGTGLTRYEELDERLDNLWYLPLLNDDYVPQGFAVDPENKRIFLAYYHRTPENVSYGYPSIIAEVFVPEGRLGNVFMLYDENNDPLASHMGGIAYWNGFLFAPSRGNSETMDPDLFAYDIQDQTPSSFDPDTLEGFTVVHLQAEKRFEDPLAVLGEEGRFNSLSFMGVHYDAAKQPYLHLGNFQHEPRPTHLFKLGLAGSGESREPTIEDPETLIQSHRRAQGMAFTFDVQVGNNKIRRAFLSNSWGNNDSTLFTSVYTGDPEPSLGVEFLSLPAGLEDIGNMGNNLITWSESGASYYQKRESPWTQLFPFMMAIDISDINDSNGNGIPDQWYSYHGIGLSVDPSTDTDEDGFDLYEEYLWDTDPNSADDYPQAQTSANPVEITMPTSLTRFYTLQKSSDLRTWEPVPGLEHRRGNESMQTFSPESDDSNLFYRVTIELE